jgi:uncharacterized protein (TIGR03435 family)
MEDFKASWLAYGFERTLGRLPDVLGFACIIVALTGSVVDASPAITQSPLSFDVVSVKPHPWMGNGGVGVVIRGDTLTAEHVTLYDLIEFAYNLKDTQLSGGPDWARHGTLAGSTLYQVIAKVATLPPPTQDQFRTMLQQLLADRFALVLRHREKDLPVYNLVAVKGGARLKESGPESHFSMHIESGNPTRITAIRVPVSMLVGHLQPFAGRTVVDETGLTGTYNFNLEFAPETLTAGGPDVAPPELAAPTLFTALEKQLGLKLQAGVAPFDSVVVDHAEKPAVN